MTSRSNHYSDVIMGATASKFTTLLIVCSILCSGADQRKHQSSASLAFLRGIHRSPVNSSHKGPVTRKCFHLMTSLCVEIAVMVLTHMSLPIGFRQHHRAILDPLARRHNRTGVRSYTGRRTSGRTAVAEDPSAEVEERKRRSHGCQPDEPMAYLGTTNRIMVPYL